MSDMYDLPNHTIQNLKFLQDGMPFTLISSGPSEECGCPEELIEAGGVEAIIHFEADGTSEAFFYGGDWEETDMTFTASNMNDLRRQALAWIFNLPEEG